MRFVTPVSLLPLSEPPQSFCSLGISTVSQEPFFFSALPTFISGLCGLCIEVGGQPVEICGVLVL